MNRIRLIRLAGRQKFQCVFANVDLLICSVYINNSVHSVCTFEFYANEIFICFCSNRIENGENTRFFSCQPCSHQPEDILPAHMLLTKVKR